MKTPYRVFILVYLTKFLVQSVSFGIKLDKKLYFGKVSDKPSIIFSAEIMSFTVSVQEIFYPVLHETLCQKNIFVENMGLYHYVF